MSPSEIAVLVEEAEAAVMADAYRALAEYAPEMAAQVQRIGGAECCMIAKLGSTFFNRVIGLGVTTTASEDTVDGVLAPYQQLGQPVAIQLSPLARPPEIAGWLEARGFRVSSNWGKFYREVSPAPRAETSLQLDVISAGDRHAFSEIMVAGFGAPTVVQPWFEATVGRPGWTHYVACDGDTPVAAAALYVDGQVGELFGAATLPSHRGRGAQSALMARRIADAATAGCRWFVTEAREETGDAPNPSYRNMLRLNFKQAYLRPNYTREA